MLFTSLFRHDKLPGLRSARTCLHLHRMGKTLIVLLSLLGQYVVQSSSADSTGGEPNGTGHQLVGELEDALLELQTFLREYERESERSQAEVELADAFSAVNRSLEALIGVATVHHRDDILQCSAAVEESARQAENDVREGLAKCYQQMEEYSEEDPEADGDSDEELRQETVDLTYVALHLVELLVGPESAKDLETPVSERASVLARRLQYARDVLRKCVDQQLEAAYRHSDRLVDAASDCFVLSHHEEL